MHSFITTSRSHLAYGHGIIPYMYSLFYTLCISGGLINAAWTGRWIYESNLHRRRKRDIFQAWAGCYKGSFPFSSFLFHIVFPFVKTLRHSRHSTYPFLSTMFCLFFWVGSNGKEWDQTKVFSWEYRARTTYQVHDTPHYDISFLR